MAGLFSPAMLHVPRTFSCHQPHTEIDGYFRERAPVPVGAAYSSTRRWEAGALICN